jgi:chromosome segregation ATPase
MVNRASRNARLLKIRVAKEVVDSDSGKCLQEKVTRIEEELENALSEVNRGQKLLAEERRLLSNIRNEASVAKDDLARERSRVAGLDKDVAEARGQLKRVKEQNASEIERLHGLVADKEREMDEIANEAKFSKVLSSSHVVVSGSEREKTRRKM